MRIAVLVGALVLLLAATPAHALQDGADRQLTTTGELAQIGKAAQDPDLARNTRTGEFLVAYIGDPVTDNHFEVYGQRLTAGGVPVGPRLTLGGVGVDADVDPDPYVPSPEPAVAYSAASDSWMVVFRIDDQRDGRPNDKFEVFARSVSGDGTLGALTKVSTTGATATATHDARHPDIAWNPDRDEFLVVWDTFVGSETPPDQIRIQRLKPDGTLLSVNQRISNSVPTSGADTIRNDPAVAYDTTRDRWLVIWFGEPNPGDSCCNAEQELFGQLLSATGAQEGPDDFRVSVTGAETNDDANAGAPPSPGVTNNPPDLVYDPIADRFLSVYIGDPATGGLPADKYEAFAQRVLPDAGRDGDAVQVSNTPATSGANTPRIAIEPLSGESLVLWWAVPNEPPFADNERDIFGQRLAPGAVALGPDFRAGQTGPDGEPTTNAVFPVLAGFPGGYQGVWGGSPGGFKFELQGDQLHIPSLSLGDLTVPESVGTAQVPLTVTNPDPAGVPIGVTAATAAGSATAPGDFTALSGPLELPALAAAATVDVPITNDVTAEPGETFTATLSAPSNAIVGDGTATITITDDDTAPGPGPGAGPSTRDPAKLQVLRAQVRRGRLDVLAAITARATGSVRMSFRSGGRTTRFTSAIASGGRIRVDRRLPASQRRRTTGILTIDYAGNARVRPDDVRLRAASGKARLTRDVTRIRARRLEVAGTISRSARGVVRVRLAYLEADGEVTELYFRARIVVPRSGPATWSIREQLPARAAAVGGQLDIQFTGYEPRLVRGEQLSKQVP